MFVIGLTGGVASGKSFVAECFERLGAQILDADQIGHAVLKRPDVVATIRSWWPSAVGRDGIVDRKSLAAIVFSPARHETDSAKKASALAQLESLMHPLIGEKIDQELADLRSRGAPAVVLDAPVMFKTGWHERCDRIVFVECAPEIRNTRIAVRGWTTDEIVKRERCQIATEEKRRRSTDVIDNAKSAEATFSQVRHLWDCWFMHASHPPEIRNHPL